jgi:hypothetical protein
LGPFDWRLEGRLRTAECHESREPFMLVMRGVAMQMRCWLVDADAKRRSTLDAGMALGARCYAIRKEHAVVGGKG